MAEGGAGIRCRDGITLSVVLRIESRETMVLLGLERTRNSRDQGARSVDAVTRRESRGGGGDGDVDQTRVT